MLFLLVWLKLPIRAVFFRIPLGATSYEARSLRITLFKSVLFQKSIFRDSSAVEQSPVRSHYSFIFKNHEEKEDLCQQKEVYGYSCLKTQKTRQRDGGSI